MATKQAVRTLKGGARLLCIHVESVDGFIAPFRPFRFYDVLGDGMTAEILGGRGPLLGIYSRQVDCWVVEIGGESRALFAEVT